MLELVAPQSQPTTQAAFAEVLERRPQHIELTILRADGAAADVAVTGIPLVINDVVFGMYGIAEDVTEQHRAARELEKTRQVATAASQAKAQLVTRMSHDIRTPLTSILAVIELLSESETSVDQVDLISTLKRSGARLLTLVDGVLDFAHASSATPEADDEFDLLPVIRDCVDLVEKAGRHKGLDIRLDISDDVPHRVRDHPTWTSQILLNVLTNAVEHTSVGGVTLTVSMEITTAQGPALLYRIEDTGEGIDPADQERIFEPFTQVGTPTASARGRAGLGLSIVEELVTISGGTISLNSAPGVGSTFLILMPVRPVPAGATPHATTSPLPPKLSANSPHPQKRT